MKLAEALLKYRQAKISGAPSVTLWGTGKALREFIDTDDLADAGIFLLNHYSGEEPVNIGTGAKSTGFLQLSQVTEEKIEKARRLNDIAASRGQLLAQMALAWILTDPRVTSVIIGASSVRQLTANLRSIDSPGFSPEELSLIQSVID